MVLRGNDTVSLALINEKEKPKKKRGPCNRALDFSSNLQGWVSLSSWEIRVCLEHSRGQITPILDDPLGRTSLVHSHPTFSVSVLCSWMEERLAWFWKHSQRSIDSFNFFFFTFFVVFYFYYYGAWSKPPKLDFCTPIISSSCKVTAQQSTLCFPFSVDQIPTDIVDLHTE